MLFVFLLVSCVLFLEVGIKDAHAHLYPLYFFRLIIAKYLISLQVKNFI